MNHAIIAINRIDNPIDSEVKLTSFALSKNIVINKIFYDESFEKDELTNRKSLIQFLNTFRNGDNLLIDSLSTLGWRVGELVQILSIIFEKDCEIICTGKDERLYPAMPAGEILAKLSITRKQNITSGKSKTIGRPEGSRSKSKYDIYLPQIIEHLKVDKNISALARNLGISRTSLKDYIISRGLN